MKTETNTSKNNQTRISKARDLPVLWSGQKDVKKAACSLKEGKSPGTNNIPAELLKQGGGETTYNLTALFQKVWELKEWPNE